MTKSYRTAMGDIVDLDALRLANETTIAIGNCKVNARGDELGHGGEILRTRAQLMQEYHKLSTPVADDTPVQESVAAGKLKTPMAEDSPVLESAADVAAQYAGNHAVESDEELFEEDVSVDEQDEQADDSDNI